MDQTVSQLQNANPLTSTAEFDKIYNLADIDYEICHVRFAPTG
jgi:hypothetical protein